MKSNNPLGNETSRNRFADLAVLENEINIDSLIHYSGPARSNFNVSSIGNQPLVAAANQTNESEHFNQNNIYKSKVLFL